MQKAIRADLYLGEVPPGAPKYATFNTFKEFLQNNVMPLFPGFSVATIDGYWKGESELSRVLSIMFDPAVRDEDACRAQVRTIAENYKREFQQESVIVTFSEVDILWDVHPHGRRG